MKKIDNKNTLNKIPKVDKLLEQIKQDSYFENVPYDLLINSIRSLLDNIREKIKKNQDNNRLNISSLTNLNEIILNLKTLLKKKMSDKLLPVINATGVVVHTNLGRSLLCKQAIDHIVKISSSYNNLEFNLKTGKRGLRYEIVENLLCELTGAESALVVNNNAGAVLLSLNTISKNKKVIVSRGELIEIGGSFRIPDVMEKSGCHLFEVGTTNRTHMHDYENAIDEETGLILKVHTSNYSIVGFTKEVSTKDLVTLGLKYNIPVAEDLGSGTLIDFSKYGLIKEPTIQDAISTGVDVVSCSGDKLLGGPQAGIILGKKHIIDKIKKNPLTRALRIDKFTLAALESTLKLYRDENEAISEIPTLNMLLLRQKEIEEKAYELFDLLNEIKVKDLIVKIIDSTSKAGGGSLPLLNLPTKCIAIKTSNITVNEIEKKFRNNNPPIIGRIENDNFIMDLRTIQRQNYKHIYEAVNNILT